MVSKIIVINDFNFIVARFRSANFAIKRPDGPKRIDRCAHQKILGTVLMSGA